MRPLLANWKAISGMPMEQETFLSALASDFNMFLPYLEYMVQACPEAANQTLFRLIPSLKRDGVSLYLATSLFLNMEDMLLTCREMEAYMLFNPQNPTGHYKLKLENSTDFAVAQQLLLLDRWECVVNRRNGRQDVSQRGNQSQLRNECHQGRSLHLSEQCLDPLPCPKSPMKAMMGSPTPLRNGGSPRTPSWATPKQTKEVGEGTNFVVSIELTEPGNLGLDFETDDGLCIVSRVWDTGAIARWNESATEKVQQFDHLVTVDENSENLASATSVSRLQERQGTVELHFRRPTWRLLEMAPNGEKLGIALARRQESGSILVRKVEPNGFIAQSGRMGQETLHVNDRIVAVNGVEGDVWQMAKQLLAGSLLVKVCSH